MIVIKDKQECCGCSACMEICPQKCITMQPDNEGFLYPVVKLEQCIECNLCIKICPVLNPTLPHEPIYIYAAKNPNEKIRQDSSSGGIFSLLAENILKEGGIVFGAAFDIQWNINHCYISETAELYKLRGSKYVQSTINGEFSEVEEFLKAGKKVIFSGTPCQIAGLKHYLKKEYFQLCTIDFVCHGVPSPLVWQTYLNEIMHKHKIQKKHIQSINFRDKCSGWKNFSFSLKYEKNRKKKELSEIFYRNHYLRGFLYDIYLRPSCYNCPVKSGKSYSDITIADFWGVQHIFPEINTDKGISLVMINSAKGELIYQQMGVSHKPTDYKTIISYNKSIEESASCPKELRNKFFKELGHKTVCQLVNQLTNFPIKERIKSKILNLLSFIKS